MLGLQLLGVHGLWADPIFGARSASSSPVLFLPDEKLTIPKLMDENLQKLKTRTPEVVFSDILINSLLKESDEAKGVIQKLQGYHREFGAHLDYKVLSKGRIGPDYSRFLLMLRYEKFPVFLIMDAYGNDREHIVTFMAADKDIHRLETSETHPEP